MKHNCFTFREKEDEEAAKLLAEELEREEELQRRRRVIQDEKLAQKLQVYIIFKCHNSFSY